RMWRTRRALMSPSTTGRSVEQLDPDVLALPMDGPWCEDDIDRTSSWDALVSHREADDIHNGAVAPEPDPEVIASDDTRFERPEVLHQEAGLRVGRPKRPESFDVSDPLGGQLFELDLAIDIERGQGELAAEEHLVGDVLHAFRELGDACCGERQTGRGAVASPVFEELVAA